MNKLLYLTVLISKNRVPDLKTGRFPRGVRFFNTRDATGKKRLPSLPSLHSHDLDDYLDQSDTLKLSRMSGRTSLTSTPASDSKIDLEKNLELASRNGSWEWIRRR